MHDTAMRKMRRGRAMEEITLSMRKPWRWQLAIAGLTLLALGVGIYLVFPRDYSDVAVGSPEYAAKWRAEFEGINDPDQAKRQFPDVDLKRFEGGDWVFGICLDSHNHRNGGTMVVKDNTGKIRAFFGHVCGNHHLFGYLRMAKSPADFYKSVSEDFHEHTYPE
jgi:hypothetical protein